MTRNVNTLSQIKFIFAAVFLFFVAIKTHALSLEPTPEQPVITKPAPTSPTKGANESGADEDEDNSNAAPLRKVQVVQIPAQQLNFKFSGFKTQWLASETDWKIFWKESRNDGEAPVLPVQWKRQSVLAIFWPSKDSVVRIPAFSGSEVTDIDGAKQLRLYFNLNSPCFGIITDASPGQLVLIDESMSDIDRVVIHSENTKSIGCF